MAYQTRHRSRARVSGLARRQHGVVSRAQLLRIGIHPQAIKHRVRVGKLHAVRRGVYAVGRGELTPHGHWMAAVLSCGEGAVLSHWSAGSLWHFVSPPALAARQSQSSLPVVRIDVSVPGGGGRRRVDLTLHRRPGLKPKDTTRRDSIPVTKPVLTLLDLASVCTNRLEAAVNEADKLGLVDPESLRGELERYRHHPGVAVLRRLLDDRTFVLTESELERRFLPIAREAGLPLPETGRMVTGFRVDFFWPGVGLVVETDGLTYHRTPAQQARDRVRDQAHAAAGLTCLRFTHSQVRFEPGHVKCTLAAVAARLQARGRLAA
ncbi:MAG: hypothetical protein K0S15_1589 [Solirubrobacterales bacterium]|nr:hypothetical protein [Solirubrobacterales bacterium]